MTSGDYRFSKLPSMLERRVLTVNCGEVSGCEIICVVWQLSVIRILNVIFSGC